MRERGLQPMLPNPEMGRAAPRRVSRDLFLEQLERVRMDAAQAAAETLGIQQRFLGVIEATAVMWRELTGEEAPATVSFARPPLSTAAGIEKRCLTSPISSNARVRLPAPRPCNCMDGCPDCRTRPDWRRFFRWGRRIA